MTIALELDRGSEGQTCWRAKVAALGARGSEAFSTWLVLPFDELTDEDRGK